jgi:hypothetical protein
MSLDPSSPTRAFWRLAAAQRAGTRRPLSDSPTESGGACPESGPLRAKAGHRFFAVLSCVGPCLAGPAGPSAVEGRAAAGGSASRRTKTTPFTGLDMLRIDRVQRTSFPIPLMKISRSVCHASDGEFRCQSHRGSRLRSLTRRGHKMLGRRCSDHCPRGAMGRVAAGRAHRLVSCVRVRE